MKAGTGRAGWMVVALAVALCGCGKRGEQGREEAGAAGYEATAEGFHKAAAADEVEVMKSLVKGGVQAGVVDAAGNTALHVAAAAGAGKSVTWLLDKGLDIDVAGAGGKTPLAVAAEAGQAAMVRQLLRQGADPAKRDAEGYKPMQRAVSAGHAAVVEELAPADRGDLDAALLMAALLGQAKVIDVLTNYGASVYARMQDGRTALMVAAENGHREAAALLLEIGANRFAVDEAGRTAADFARERSDAAMVELLEKPVAAEEVGLEDPDALGARMLGFLEQERGPEEGAVGDGADPAGKEGGAAVETSAGGKAGVEKLAGAVVSAARAVDGQPERGGSADAEVSGKRVEAVPPLVMRHYRETELPVRVKSAAAGKARVEVMSPQRVEAEVAAGEVIPGTRLRVTRVDVRLESSKLDDGKPQDVSRVEVEDQRSGLRREWVAGNPALAHEPLAVIEDVATGRRYLAREGDRFRTRDGVDYVVGDVRASQVVLEKTGTGETVTLPMRGPRG